MEIVDQTFQLKAIPFLSQLMTTHSATLLIQMNSVLEIAMLSDQSRSYIHFFLKDTYFPTRRRQVTRSRGAQVQSLHNKNRPLLRNFKSGLQLCKWDPRQTGNMLLNWKVTYPSCSNRCQHDCHPQGNNARIYNKPTRCNSGSILFIKNYKYVPHVSDAICIHLQEHYKL